MGVKVKQKISYHVAVKTIKTMERTNIIAIWDNERKNFFKWKLKSYEHKIVSGGLLKERVEDKLVWGLFCT